MKARRKTVVALVTAGTLIPAALLALYFLNPMLSVPLLLLAVFVLLGMTRGVSRQRRDHKDRLLAEAAKRGDMGVFVNPRDNRWW